MKSNWRNPDFAFGLILAASVLAGLALRVYLLPDQLIIDDEWHGLYYTIGKSPVWLLTHFSIPGATCIPLNFYTWAVGATVGWSETALRLPCVIAGVLGIATGGWLARDLVGRRRAALLAGMLAISPMLIFYSRINRPYSFVGWLCLAALLLAARWQESGKRNDGIWFATAGILAIYFHLFAVIAVAAPFLAVLGLHLQRRFHHLPAPAGPTAKQWFAAGLAVAFGTAILVGPALVASLRSTFFKVALTGTLHWGSAPEVAMLLAGTGQPVLAVLFWVAAAAGAVELCRRRPWFGGMLVSLYPLHLLALVLSRPDSAQSAIVLARYCLPLVPVSLLFAACGLFAGLEALGRRMPLRPALTGSAVAGALVTLAFAGPLPQCYVSPNNFTSHGVYQHRYGIIDWNRSFYSDLTPPGYPLVTTIRADEVSPFYRQVGERPGTAPVVEYPMPIGDHFNPLYYYQHFHGRPVLAGYAGIATNAAALPEGNIYGDTHIDRVLGLVRDPAWLKFRQCVAMDDLAAMRRRGVEYIIIHKQFEAQLSRIVAAPAEMDRLARLYRQQLGAPIHQDAFIAVWKMN
jgi:hypothetical protein